MFHAAGPSRIIFVRHGQREDHADERWRLTTPRPHDAPLTLAGKQAAFELGVYLGRRGVVPSRSAVAASPLSAAPTSLSDCAGGESADVRTGTKRSRRDEEAECVGAEGSVGDNDLTSSSFCDDVVILCSPLVRTVQTGHHIACGIMAAAAAAAGPSSLCPEAESAVSEGRAKNEDEEAPYVPSVAGFSDTLFPSTVVTAGTASTVPSLCVPLYLEPGVMEGPYWMNHDIRTAHEMGSAAVAAGGLAPMGSGVLRRLSAAAVAAAAKGNGDAAAAADDTLVMVKPPVPCIFHAPSPLSLPLSASYSASVSDFSHSSSSPPSSPLSWRRGAKKETTATAAQGVALVVRAPRDEAALHPRPIDAASAAVAASNPVFFPPAYHRAFVSALVQPTAFPHRAGGGCDNGNENGRGGGGCGASLMLPNGCVDGNVVVNDTYNCDAAAALTYGFACVEFSFEAASGSTAVSSSTGSMAARAKQSGAAGGKFAGVGGGVGAKGGRIVELDVFEAEGGAGSPTPIGPPRRGGASASASASSSAFGVAATADGGAPSPRRRPLLRHGSDVQMRCYETAAAIANCGDALHGKTVIVVGHGQTVRDAASRLAPKVLMVDRPKYTAFCDVTRTAAHPTTSTAAPATSGGQPTIEEEAAGATAHHLRPAPLSSVSAPQALPCGGNGGKGGRAATESPTHSFRLTDGSAAFAVPHLPTSLLREC